jgi:uncharacterized protein (DUF305 family)
MNTNTLLVGLIALIIGAGGGYLIGNTPNSHMMPDGSMMHNEMNSMMAELSGKTGDDFDKAFLSEMIIHHEGAVDMAEAALQNAKHAELKTMAEAIISAQTAEIEQMKNWYKDWYGTTL